MTDNRHQNYEILNLIGYGLAKFDIDFVRNYGFSTKSAFYAYIISIGVADTVGVIKNRQDLFDPFFSNPRAGWWQKGNTYLHRKEHIDGLFGSYEVEEYVNVVKLYIADKSRIIDKKAINISPIVRSKFKQLQATGQEAELYFMRNYLEFDVFKGGIFRRCEVVR